MKLQEKEHLEVDAEASEIFARRLASAWEPEDQAKLEARLGADRAFADAYRCMEEAWGGLDQHAESPEFIAYRERALAHARKAGAKRWRKPNANTRSRWQMAAMVAGVATLGVIWQLSPYGYVPNQYETGIGEQRIVELEDHSLIALDAATRLHVRYSKDARIVDLKRGQAQFTVAADAARPFKVQAGGQTIIALGTVFTVEFTDQKVHVAMMEGRVAVTAGDSSPRLRLPSPSDVGNPHPSSSTPPSPSDGEGLGVGNATIELAAGEELHVNREGHATVTPNADIEAATAWRQGKIIFRAEPIGEAIERLNRYSRVQIKVDDPTLAARNISGIFEAGDTQGFVSIIQRYLPVIAEPSESDVITLRLK